MSLKRRSAILSVVIAVTTALIAAPAATALAQTPSYGEALAINVANVVVGTVYLPYGHHATRWNPRGPAIDLGTLPGGHFSVAQGINAWGEIAGASDTGSAGNKAVYWSPSGKITALPGIASGPSAFSSATAVNDAGILVGYSMDSEYRQYAVRWSRNGRISTLRELPGETSAQAFAINDSGVAVGYSQNQSSEYAVRWSPDGRITRLAVPVGAASTSAYGINNAGYVVGSAYNPTTSESYAEEWYPDGSVHQLAGGQQSIVAMAINDFGVVVGNNEQSNGGLDTTIWYPDGQTRILPARVGYVFFPSGINDRGFVAGTDRGYGPARPVRVSPNGNGVYLDSPASATGTA